MCIRRMCIVALHVVHSTLVGDLLHAACVHGALHVVHSTLVGDLLHAACVHGALHVVDLRPGVHCDG